MESKGFYMIYLEGGNNPTFKHSTFESADIEAKRLAKKYGRKAYILSTLKSVEIDVFKEIDCRPNDCEMPF